MNKRNSYLLLVAIVISLVSCAQVAQTGLILEGLKGKINTSLPVIDSLPKPALKDLAALQQPFGLTDEEILEIRKQKIEGVPLKENMLPGQRRVSARDFFAAFGKSDSSSLKFMSELSSIYLISAPVVFHDGTKAIISVDLLLGQGVSYLLKKENGIWILEKEHLRWVS